MAATEVAKLVVELEARVTKLESGMKRAHRSVTNFERGASGAFSRIGASFRHLALRMTGITAILAAGLGTFSAVAFVRGSIEAASAMDTFEVRLRALVGSGERTSAMLEELREFAAKVAPELRDVIGAATTLGTVAVGAPKRIVELTKAAANVAAVTGLTLDQAAQNLQRTLSAGIGAADLFRERGVRALVEVMTGIPDLIKISVEEQGEALLKVFGPNGIFGQSAEQFSSTLPGAISNTKDALFTLQAAFGEAISPAIIAVLKEVIIPTFNDLSKAIKDNEKSIQDYATRGLKAGVLGLVEMGRALLELIKLIAEANSLLKSARVGFAQGIVGIARLQTLLPALFKGKLEAPKTPSLVAAEGVLRDMQLDSAKAKLHVAELEVALNGVGKAFDLLEGKADKLGVETADAAKKAAAEADAFGLKQEEALAAAQRAVDPRLMQDIEAATKRTVTLLENSAVAAARGRSEYEGRVLEIDRENRKLQENLEIINKDVEAYAKRIPAARQAVAEAKNERERKLANITLDATINQLRQAEEAHAELIAKAEQRINDNLRERAQMLGEETSAKKDVRGLITDIRDLSAEVAKYDTERSEEINDQLFSLIGQAKSLEDLRKSLQDLRKAAGDDVKKTREEYLKPIGEDLAAGLTDALSGVFQNLRDPAKDFAEYLADISSSLLDSAISNTMDSLQDELKKIFESMELSKGMETAVMGAAGIAIGLIGGALRKTEVETSADKVKSAITNVQAVRGVVAGPTQIGIAQVGETIENAFIETNFILHHGNDVLERILAAVGGRAAGLGGGNVATSTDTALGATAPSLV